MKAGAIKRGLARLLMWIAVWAAATACQVPDRRDGRDERCAPKQAPPPPIAQTSDAAEPIPDFKVELRGEIVSESGTDAIFMTLASEAQRISGAIRIANQKTFRITEARLTAQNEPSWRPAVHGRFRLDFAVDGCEHTPAEPAGVPYRWDPCFYYAKAPKPDFPAWGEAWIDFNGLPYAFIVTAVGTNDVWNLSGAFRMTGVARK